MFPQAMNLCVCIEIGRPPGRLPNSKRQRNKEDRLYKAYGAVVVGGPPYSNTPHDRPIHFASPFAQTPSAPAALLHQYLFAGPVPASAKMCSKGQRKSAHLQSGSPLMKNREHRKTAQN